MNHYYSRINNTVDKKYDISYIVWYYLSIATIKQFRYKITLKHCYFSKGILNLTEYQ